MTYSNGTVIKGYFKNGEYSMTENMYKLVRIFAQTPSGSVLPKEVISKWQKLGPFNLTGPIAEGKLKINELVDVKSVIKINTSTTFEGQL